MPIWSVAGMALAAIGGPVVIAVTAGGLLWGLLGGWRRAQAGKAKAAQAELQRHLREILQEVHRYFFSVDQKSGRASLVDEYFTMMEQHLGQQVNLVVAQRVAEAKDEFGRLQANAQLDNDQRAKALASAETDLARWRDIGTTLGRLLSDPRAAAHLQRVAAPAHRDQAETPAAAARITSPDSGPASS